MENSNPRTPSHRVTWTIGSYDEPEPPPPAPQREHSTSVLRVAQLILAALDPFPEAYQAVLTALRTLPFPLPTPAPSP